MGDVLLIGAHFISNAKETTIFFTNFILLAKNRFKLCRNVKFKIHLSRGTKATWRIKSDKPLILSAIFFAPPAQKWGKYARILKLLAL